MKHKGGGAQVAGRGDAGRRGDDLVVDELAAVALVSAGDAVVNAVLVATPTMPLSWPFAFVPWSTCWHNCLA